MVRVFFAGTTGTCSAGAQPVIHNLKKVRFFEWFLDYPPANAFGINI
jgi:hypothetical protein